MSIILNNTDIFKDFKRVLSPMEICRLMNRTNLFDLENDPRCYLLKKYYVDYIIYRQEKESPDPIRNYINMEAGGMLKGFNDGIYKSMLILKGDDSFYAKQSDLSYINIVNFSFEVITSRRYWLFEYFFGVKKVVKVSTVTSYYYFTYYFQD